MYELNTEIDKVKNQDNCCQFSEMYELRQPSNPFGVANETSDDTSIMNENSKEPDYHMVRGPTKIILKHISNQSNTTNTNVQNAKHLSLEHPEPSDPVNQTAQAIEKLARRNPEPSIFHSKNALTSNGKLEKMRSSSTLKIFSTQHLKCSHISLKR